MNKEKQRIEYLDIAKGLGIIFVILAHIGISNIADTWMYSFHLPLFYAISGYCFNYKDQFSQFLKRRIKKCIVPYFFLGLCLVAVESYTGYLYEKGLKNNFYRFLLQKRYSTLWFLATLFVASLIFWLVVKVSQEKPIAVLSLSIIISLVAYYYAITIWDPLYWNGDVAAFITVFLGIGYFIAHEAKITPVIKRLKSSIRLQIAVIICLLAINILFCYLNFELSGWRMDMYWNQYGFYPYTVIAAVSGALCFMLLSYTISYSMANYTRTRITFLAKGLQLLGKNSIIYFAWHQSMIIAPMMAVLNKMKIPDFSAKILVFMGIMIICTLADIVIRSTRLKILIGE